MPIHCNCLASSHKLTNWWNTQIGRSSKLSQKWCQCYPAEAIGGFAKNDNDRKSRGIIHWRPPIPNVGGASLVSPQDLRLWLQHNIPVLIWWAKCKLVSLISVVFRQVSLQKYLSYITHLALLKSMACRIFCLRSLRGAQFRSFSNEDTVIP